MPGPWRERSSTDAASELASLLALSNDVATRRVARSFLGSATEPEGPGPRSTPPPGPSPLGTQQRRRTNTRGATPSRLLAGDDGVIRGGGQPSTGKKVRPHQQTESAPQAVAPINGDHHVVTAKQLRLDDGGASPDVDMVSPTTAGGAPSPPRPSETIERNVVDAAAQTDDALPTDVDELHRIIYEQRLRIEELEGDLQAFDDDVAAGAERLQQQLAELDG